jgi:hypothetical protein
MEVRVFDIYELPDANTFFGHGLGHHVPVLQ